MQSAHAVLVAAQLALEAARRSLVERQEVLLQQVQRALAYARVYAEADEALSAQLEAVTLPRAAKRARTDGLGANDALVLTSEAQPAPRPRGRPRKPAQVPAPTSEPLAHAGE